MAGNNTTGAPFNLELNTPGVPMSTLQTDNGKYQNINDNAMHKSIYDPTGVDGDAFRASNHKMAGYAKASEKTAIVSGDSALSAIAKLEAGVDASGDMKKATYDTDGSGKVDTAKVADKANSVEWNSVNNRPNAMPNPNALTLQLNGETKATYTGNAVASVNITPAAIGAASLVGGKVPAAQLDIVDATDSTEKTKMASANSVRVVKGEVASAIEEVNDHLEDIDAALANKADKQLTQTLTWFPLSVPSGFDNSNAFYTKNQVGTVTVTGYVRSLSTQPANTTIFNIPALYRPGRRIYASVSVLQNSYQAYIDREGDFVVEAALPTGYVIISSLRYDAER